GRFAADLREAVSRAAAGARVVFTAHSVPERADLDSGPADGTGRLYSRQVAESACLVAREAGVADHDLVWQSRSGPPHVPWLEPDVVDHVRALHADRADHHVGHTLLGVERAYVVHDVWQGVTD